MVISEAAPYCVNIFVPFWHPNLVSLFLASFVPLKSLYFCLNSPYVMAINVGISVISASLQLPGYIGQWFPFANRKNKLQRSYHMANFLLFQNTRWQLNEMDQSKLDLRDIFCTITRYCWQVIFVYIMISSGLFPCQKCLIVQNV